MGLVDLLSAFKTKVESIVSSLTTFCETNNIAVDESNLHSIVEAIEGHRFANVDPFTEIITGIVTLPLGNRVFPVENTTDLLAVYLIRTNSWGVQEDNPSAVILTACYLNGPKLGYSAASSRQLSSVSSFYRDNEATNNNVLTLSENGLTTPDSLLTAQHFSGTYFYACIYGTSPNS